MNHENLELYGTLSTELVSQRRVVILRSDRLRANGDYIGMITALTETDICNTCIHVIWGELVIAIKPTHKSIAT